MDNKINKTNRISTELLTALRRGNRDAYSKVYIHYQESVCDFLTSVIRSREIAEDITHNVFIAVWENREKIDPHKDVERYLFAVAKNMTMRYFRRKRMENDHSRFIWLQSIQEILPDELLFAKEAALLVEYAITRMPQTRRQVFTMHYKGGFSYTKIADKMGLNKNTVANHLTLAKNDIRKMFKGWYKKSENIFVKNSPKWNSIVEATNATHEQKSA